MSNSVLSLATGAKKASYILAASGTKVRNAALYAIADALWANKSEIISANGCDLRDGRENGLSDGLIDRLTLNEARIEGICDGIRQIAALPDPLGTVDGGWTRPNGLNLIKRRVPLGVIGIIFEARPNVTADAAALCLKSGNTCILRGGKEAIMSNIALVTIMRRALKESGLPEDSVNLITDTSRDSAKALMEATGYVDVLIPRGGKGLIRAVVEGAKVPVIETGAGVCHTYVDAYADLNMAVKIIENAKCSRPSVCNAMEQLLVDESKAEVLLTALYPVLSQKNVEFRCCEKSFEILTSKGMTKGVVHATDDDFKTEFNDYILGVYVTKSLDEAICRINENGTRHSECIVTESLRSANEFCERVDAAAVYVNASTRFTDGNEFGFGAEIGISTQKLHARGPMGLSELTTVKYIVTGDGTIR